VVTVQYEIEEAPPARVGSIFIVGNERTRQNVILRQLPLYPGQLLTYPDLRTAERNLQRLGIFENGAGPNGAPSDASAKPTVTVIDSQDPNSPYKDILVTVAEANTGSLVFGAGVNSNAGLTGSIVLNERNFDIFKPPTSFDELLSGNAWRGAGQEFRIEAVPGTELQRYTVSFREPFLFDTPNSLGVSGYYYTRDYNEYDEERVGGRFTLGRKITPEWTLSLSTRIEEIDVNNVVDFAPPQISDYVGSHFLVGPRVAATYDTRDSFIRPTQGTLFEVSYEEDFGDYTFPVVTAGANQYFTLWQRPDGSGRQVLSLKSQISWAGNDTPVYERFYAGGFQSIRGFEFRGVGPDIDGFKIGGDFMLLNSAEYQVPLLANDNVFMVFFVDSGTVESKVEITDYRVAAGFGLRLVVPMLGPVPIALDFGFPIVKGPADNTQVFSFFMGFSH
jgi:outer membrane protein insertion porin family